jgi:heme exporter protein D
MTMAEFFTMEGHGIFVWTSYALGLLTFIGLYVSTFATKKRLEKQLRRQIRMQTQNTETNSNIDD